ncbi:MAG TPA: RNHCP domain-containing protein [Anaerolineales bacterium]|nr:RNHCP domain-containing protein [Anaerolineales bacterium]
MRYHLSSFGDFTCSHCQAFVSSLHQLSGVQNRNHCPYCLWSCHLDLYVAGDRLSACKTVMKPIGLTMKKGRNKYRPESRGELMLIHKCVECQAVSINRIAADDDAETVITVFHESFVLRHQIQTLRDAYGIIPLNATDIEMVYEQLYGQTPEISLLRRVMP